METYINTTEYSNLVLLPLYASCKIPYELLLLADPSQSMINEYLFQSTAFVAKLDDEVVGIIVLLPNEEGDLEIKNVSVKPAFQRRGVGSFLIRSAIRLAKEQQYKSISIGTANSSLTQLSLYQKLGFEVVCVRKGFFLKHYDEPIYENGIQAIDMVVLSRKP